MKTIYPDSTPKKDFHQFMLGGIVPRPIALLSTIDKKGINNLAPFSYFNAVSSIPPILMVSIGRKADGSKKDSLINVEETGEFVVNMVHHALLHPMALSSVAFPSKTDEFDMTGLTPLPSENIKAMRVKEAKIQFECRLREIKNLGEQAGEGSLIFGDVLCIHIDESIIGENNRLLPDKMDMIGRLGRSYYTRIKPESILTVVQAQQVRPIGYPALPVSIRNSQILSANDLSVLAAQTSLPDEKELEELRGRYASRLLSDENIKHTEIKKAIEENKIELALKITYL
jgi:flavin reductase (DIM6/NTAB) family NADH-FMN oxidoreductase RutF